jgi:hypothetical protein
VLRRLFLVVAVALVALPACSEGRGAATIDDPGFVRRANAVCARSLPGLRAPERRATSTTVVSAERLDAVADGLGRVAARLREVPVSDGAAGAVDAWLDDWDRFVAVGHRYAGAVDADDQQEYTRIDDEAVRLAVRIGKFARANRIDSCVL